MMRTSCKLGQYVSEVWAGMRTCPAKAARRQASALVEDLTETARGFSVLDFAVFKTTLFSLGLLLGARFYAGIRKHRLVILIGFLCSYVYLIWRIFLRGED